MQVVSCSAFRRDLRAYLDKTRDDTEPVMVTSKDPDANVVVMNARDYDNLIENLYIAQNRYLSDKLMKSREQFARQGTSRHFVQVVDVRYCVHYDMRT